MPLEGWLLIGGVLSLWTLGKLARKAFSLLLLGLVGLAAVALLL